MLLLVFLSSGLFLGWSLGANDASNVFGTAVATRMIKFKTAAWVCSIFVILGACISGAGASHTLGQLGSVNAIAGSFMVSLAAAVTILWMTKLGLPISTSQAVVGAIIGWNLFSGSLTDYSSLSKIAATWVLCPILAAIIAVILFKIMQLWLKVFNIHLLRLDAYTRVGLIVVGAFGSYSLGANNIANVMGVFVPVAPFVSLNLFDWFSLSSAQQLFILGAIAISVGVFTYSYKVMATVGSRVVKLNPQTALVVVAAESLVLFLFASEGLESWLLSHGLPAIPLVPVSSSQAVIGAVLGIGLVKGAKNVSWKVLGNIALGWVITPILAGIISFFALFFLQNVFQQQVYRPVTYILSEHVIQELRQHDIVVTEIEALATKNYANAQDLVQALTSDTSLSHKQRTKILAYAQVDQLKIDAAVFARKLDQHLFTPRELQDLNNLQGKIFQHQWQLYNALHQQNSDWRLAPEIPSNRVANKNLQAKLEYLYNTFRIHTMLPK